MSENDNSDFLDMLEDYFDQDEDVKMKDCRPNYHYQVGATPHNVELPRCGRDDDCLDLVSKVF